MLNEFVFKCLSWLAIVHTAFIGKTAVEDGQHMIGIVFMILSSLIYVNSDDLFKLINGHKEEQN